MATTHRRIQATPDQVWDVLADGWLYPVWVVGASRMREVDDAWPAVGARLHHSAGTWPLLIDDTTSVLECTPRRLLVLQARGWPMGEATVRIEIEPAGAASTVTIVENPTKGPGALVPPGLRDIPMHHRNTETLRRLAYVAERRHHTDPTSRP